MARWRCAECESGDHIEAIAYGYVEGPLDGDGEILRYDSVEDFGPEESTIRCVEHPAAGVHKFVGDAWHEWEPCDRCGGMGRVAVRTRYFTTDWRECGSCRSEGGRWVAIALAPKETR